MPRAQWPFLHRRPSVQIVLTLANGGTKVVRNLLADTGAGDADDLFDLLLRESDCLLCDGALTQTVTLGGAYSNTYPVYLIRVEIPLLAFDHDVLAVAVPDPPPGFDGFACFRFLNRFTYGNFGNPLAFGLEV